MIFRNESLASNLNAMIPTLEVRVPSQFTIQRLGCDKILVNKGLKTNILKSDCDWLMKWSSSTLLTSHRQTTSRPKSNVRSTSLSPTTQLWTISVRLLAQEGPPSKNLKRNQNAGSLLEEMELKIGQRFITKRSGTMNHYMCLWLLTMMKI